MSKKNKKIIDRNIIFLSSGYVIEETKKCIEYFERLYNRGSKLNEAEIFFMKLALEKSIVNIHQIRDVFTRHTGLELNNEITKKISTIRDCITHVYTDKNKIFENYKAIAEYNLIGPNSPKAYVINERDFENNSDDIIVFYGKNELPIIRGVFRTFLEILEHYNKYSEEKIIHSFDEDLVKKIYSTKELLF
jgi:hypothetical protein